MMLTELKEIKNRSGEKLEFLMEGNPSPDELFIYAHGFGNDLHDRGLADDIAGQIILKPNSAILRFSFSGYGRSEGKQSEKSIYTMSEDFRDVYELVSRHSNRSEISVITFSMASHVLAILNGLNFKRVLFISPSGMETKVGMQEYFKNSRDLKIDDRGIWYIPRRSGTITEVGQSFWDALDSATLARNMKIFTENNNVYFLIAMDDEVSKETKVELFSGYRGEVIKISGSHDFLGEDRKDLLRELNKLI